MVNSLNKCWLRTCHVPRAIPGTGKERKTSKAPGPLKHPFPWKKHPKRHMSMHSIPADHNGMENNTAE